MARDGERGRGDWKARRGSHNSGPYAEASGDTGPVDIAAVRRDDALIDAIASDGPVQTDSVEEYQLATLLASWRAELITPPMRNEPDLDAIVAAVNQEIGARQVRVNAQTGGRLRLLRPIAGTAAALALVIGGMTAFSYNAEPGDPLWRVKEVVFSEQAQTTVVQRTDDDLTAAETLLNQGASPEQVKAKLDGAKRNATQVNDTQKQDDLVVRFNALLAELRKVSPEVADQVAPITTPVKPSTDTRPSTGNNGTVSGTPKPNPGTEPTGPSSQPGDTGKPTTDPSTPPTTTGGKPTTTVPTTTQPNTTAEPSTPAQPPTVAPTTVASSVVEPTVDTGAPTQPQHPAPRSPNSGSTPGSLVLPSGSVGPGFTVPGS
ncbi:anti-sigma-D factor RsdA [Nocardia sp. NPDC052566]|uniref:anti-sigma-D factor RsdA n=1 Tax=Nocardia sp. NPDC052566 TaxID=3364330 RepID=UPI0037CAC54D